MEDAIIFCGAANCGKAASRFIQAENKKFYSCADHIPSLVSTLQDLSERSALVTKGRGNVTALCGACDSELAAALRDIERIKNHLIKTVESRFEEMIVVVTKMCNESKRQLQQLEEDFKQFLASKENQLSPTASLLCTDMSITPKFVRFNIADVSDSVSAALGGSWEVGTADIYPTLRCFDANQMNAAIESALAEATTRAWKGILEALEYANSMIGDDTSFEQEKNIVVSGILTFAKTQNTKNLYLIQYFWDLRQQCELLNDTTVEVGKRLARLFYHQLGRFSEAEAILRKCYDIASQQSAVSELPMLICNEICGVYFASERYQDVENLGTWVLETFGAANFSSEHYWTTLLYISHSMSELSKNDEANAIIESWSKRDIPEETTFGKMMRLLTCRIGASSAEAERCLLQAQRIGMSYFSTSPFTALALFHLGLSTLPDARGEQYLRQAEMIYEAASPKSAQAAKNLTKLGDLSKLLRRQCEAEKYYRQAQSVYETTSSKSYNAVVNLLEFGDLCFSMKRWDEVGNCCRQVESIIQEADPEQRSRMQNVAAKLAALRIRPASPPPPVLPEERKIELAKVPLFACLKNLFQRIWTSEECAAGSTNMIGANCQKRGSR